MINIIYKIKVGIDEFDIKESDIGRVTEAMQTNNMVSLDCGIFRGQSILAIIKRENITNDYTIRELSPDEKKFSLLKESREKCPICIGVGLIYDPEKKLMKQCLCQKNEN